MGRDMGAKDVALLGFALGSPALAGERVQWCAQRSWSRWGVLPVRSTGAQFQSSKPIQCLIRDWLSYWGKAGVEGHFVGESAHTPPSSAPQYSLEHDLRWDWGG